MHGLSRPTSHTHLDPSEPRLRTRTLIASFAAAAVAVGSALSALSAAGEAKHLPPGTHLLLTFDHREPLKRGTVVRDASGHRHRGVVRTRAGGAVRPVDGWFRRAAAFPRLCDPTCGRAIVEV